MSSIRLHSYLVRLIWICIAPLLVVLTVFAAMQLADLRSDEAREAQALAQNFANSIDRQLDSRIGGLQMLGTSPLIRDRERWQELYQTAQGFRETFGHHVLFASASGQMIFNTRLPYGTALAPLLRPKGHSAAASALATRKPAVGDTVIGPFKRPIVAIAVPAFLPNDRDSHLVLTFIETSYFQELLDELVLPKGWRISLLDGKKDLVARRAAKPDETAVDQVNRYSVHLRNAPWTVAINAPDPLLGVAMTESATLLTLLILGSVLAGVVGGRLAGRNLVRAINTLATATEPAALPATATGIVEIEAIRDRLSESSEARHQSELKLIESERRLLMAQEAAKAGTWEWDLASNANYWSDAAYRLYGYEPGSCAASYDNWLSAIHPDDRQRVTQAVEAAGRVAGAISLEWRVNRPAGDECWLMSRGEPQFDAEGRLQSYLGIVMDITERMLAEESQRIWAEAFEQSDIGLSLGDPVSQQILAVNPAFTRRRGYTQDELVGRPVSMLFPPERFAEVMDHVRRASETGHVNFETEHLCKNGDRFPVMLDITVVKDPHGRPVSRLVHALDITERKRAETRLRESQERLRTLVATIPDLVWLKDAEGTYLACNTRFELFLGAPQDGIIGKTDYDFLAREQADEFRASDLATAESGRPHVSEREIRFASDGHHELVQTIKTPLFDERGQVIAVLGVARDITQIRENERELERYKLQLEDLVRQRTEELAAAHEKLKHDAARIADLYDHAPVGYHSLDPSGIIVEANETELKMLGYSREEYIGKRVLEFFTPASRDLFMQRFDEFRRTGRVRNLDYEVVRKDGSILPVLISADMVRDESGNFLFNRATMADDTERRRHERAIAVLQDELARRAQAAEAANVAKSTFLANMSHEIRTPMNAIIGLAHLLRVDSPNSIQAERLHKIDSAAQHLLSIINDILDLSKIEAGKVTLEEKNFALDQVLDHVRSLIGDSAQAKGITIEVDPDHVPTWLRGDLTRVRQCLLNYANNAVKFTSEGKVSLRADIVRNDGTDILVRFEVEDSGIGLSPEAISRIFRKFEQADAGTTREYGGTGLGLSITKRLAELMGGEVGVESTPGQGSRFWFTCRLQHGSGPMPAGERLPATTASELKRMRGGASLLLVEDNAVNVEVALELLHGAAMRVDVAENGQVAVEKASASRYDLILMDMQMPVMDGLQASRAIRALPEWHDKPILAMTANAFDDDRAACLAAGMNDFITKPVDPDALYAKLRQWLPAMAGGAGPSVTDRAPRAGGDDDEGILDKLALLPDVDLPRALAMVRGHKVFFLKLLRQFAARMEDQLAEMETGLAAEDLEAARRVSHTLKGTSGSLGLIRIFKAASALDKALRQPACAVEDARALLREVREAASTLTAALQGAEGI